METPPTACGADRPARPSPRQPSRTAPAPASPIAEVPPCSRVPASACRRSCKTSPPAARNTESARARQGKRRRANTDIGRNRQQRRRTKAKRTASVKCLRRSRRNRHTGKEITVCENDPPKSNVTEFKVPNAGLNWLNGVFDTDQVVADEVGWVDVWVIVVAAAVLRLIMLAKAVKNGFRGYSQEQ